jgi:hypothetical protein
VVNDWRVTDHGPPHHRRHRLYEAGNRSLNDPIAIKATNIFSGHQVRYGFRRRRELQPDHQRTARPSWRRTAARPRPARITVLNDINFGRSTA